MLKQAGIGIGLTALAGCQSGSNSASNKTTTEAAASGLDSASNETATEAATTDAASAATNDSQNNTEAATSSTSGQVSRGGTLQVAAAGDPENLDPHTTTIDTAQKILDNVMEGLFELNANLQPRPVLATDYSISDDRTTYEIQLKEGVSFHNGSELTSADVTYTIERILDPDLGSPRAANFNLLDTVEAVDDYTVRFNLTEPFAPFLLALSESAPIVPEGVKTETLNQTPVGTGPFTLGSYQTDDQVTLAKFDNYHIDGLPYLDGVTFDIVPEAATRLTQLNSGPANVMFGVPFQNADQIENTSNTSLQAVPSLFKQCLWFNTDQEPFDQPIVRRAVSHAINREQIVQGVLFGSGEPAHSPAVPASAWQDRIENKNPHTGGQEEATALLEEAGVDPSSVSVSLKASRTPGPTYADTATLIESQLSQLDMSIEVQIMDFSTWLQEVWENQNYALSIGSWSGRSDPDGWYYRQYRSDGTWNKFNYSNSEVDDLVDQGRTAVEMSKRASIYSQIEDIISQDTPMAYLYFQESLTGLENTVGGYELTSTQQAAFDDVYLNG